MDYRDRYKKWLEFPGLDKEIREELLQISDQKKEIAARFSRELTFGTGGIRGRMGAGSSRLNIYIIRKVTEGLARFIQKYTSPKNMSSDAPRVVIAYDTRKNSDRFAREAASVLLRWDIKVYLFSEPAATPLLSFAVRELNAIAGIVITASHNPAQDNGYKVYWSDGGQITDALANSITAEIATVKNELLVKTAGLKDATQQGMLVSIGENIFSKYLEHLSKIRLDNNHGKHYPHLKVVYTPLYGTGKNIIPQALQAAGLKNLFIVSSQAKADPNFSTIKHPNPEEWDTFELAVKLAVEKSADLILATDLDADRLGAAIKDENGRFIPLTGNQLGCLLLEYILSRRQKQQRLPINGIVIKTVVTSEMGRSIASSYGITTLETLTGFKYIGEKIKELVDSGQKTFLFGYEESCGFLIDDFVRDKDAIQASQLTVEMAAYYKSKGISLIQALDNLYKKYGYFMEELVNIDLDNQDPGQAKKTVEFFRKSALNQIGDKRVTHIIDYLTGESIDTIAKRKTATGLPTSNSLKYLLEEDSWFCIRPSGTEPKIKFYFGVKSTSKEKAIQEMDALKSSISELLRDLSATK
ncbi:MAG: phospho-sugar mutase [Firmicutes bacterium]|nr:phospho-sugar mutase [Bacillota bacterium]